MIRRPQRATLLPYTTLFRPFRIADDPDGKLRRRSEPFGLGPQLLVAAGEEDGLHVELAANQLAEHLRDVAAADPRSEEHTSELQSRQYLVCRLLLEQKTTPS